MAKRVYHAICTDEVPTGWNAVARLLGVTDRTIRNWRDAHPTLERAFHRGVDDRVAQRRTLALSGDGGTR